MPRPKRPANQPPPAPGWSSSARAGFVRIPSRISTELNGRLEAWIAAQPMRPSKTAAIAYLIELGLYTHTKSRGK